MLETGNTLPDFTIPTDRGTFKLADNAGKNVVVFFFPRADTSGCTKEAIAFSGLLGEFAAANCVVIGISKDTAAKQSKFRAKHNLTVDLEPTTGRISASSSVSGSRSRCMVKAIWASSGPHL